MWESGRLWRTLTSDDVCVTDYTAFCVMGSNSPWPKVQEPIVFFFPSRPLSSPQHVTPLQERFFVDRHAASEDQSIESRVFAWL